jgi:hypothetical protein
MAPHDIIESLLIRDNPHASTSESKKPARPLELCLPLSSGMNSCIEQIECCLHVNNYSAMLPFDIIQVNARESV